MVSVMRTFTVDRPAAEVLDYLSDFSNTPEWDPGTVECHRLDNGPVAVGSTWRNVSRIAGRQTELTYRLRTLESDHLVFVGTNDAAAATDDITVTPDQQSSTITYRATITLKGAAKLLEPAMKLLFERLADKTTTRLATVLAPD